MTCLRCNWDDDGHCRKCGRPKGASKSWQPEGHSPMGGSAAERFMECPASVQLIDRLGLRGNDDDVVEDEWTAEGTLAHFLAAHCLSNNIPDTYLFVGGEGEWEAVTPQIAEAVQVYLDYVNGLLGTKFVEHKFHRPDVHPLMYGAIDCAVFREDMIEIIDFKNGAGVIVPVEHNKQLLYYASGILNEGIPDMPVKMTIVQPNAWHADGRIRSWTTTAQKILDWRTNELVPSMNLALNGKAPEYRMGEHCRFCPAKLACPAFHNLTEKALADAGELTGTESKPVIPEGWQPSITAEDCSRLAMLVSAYKKWAFGKLMAGADPQSVGAKLAYGRADRVWKDGAAEALAGMFGDKAWQPPKLLSPAQAEDLPGGKAFVAEHAYKPDGAPIVIPLSDPRAPYIPNLPSAIRGEHTARALAANKKM